MVKNGWWKSSNLWILVLVGKSTPETRVIFPWRSWGLNQYFFMGKSMKPGNFFPTKPIHWSSWVATWGANYYPFLHRIGASTCLVPIEEPRFLNLILMFFFRAAGRGRKQRAKFFWMKTILDWLVVYQPLWKIWLSQWEGLSMIIPYIMENKKCSKPPTSQDLFEKNKLVNYYNVT